MLRDLVHTRVVIVFVVVSNVKTLCESKLVVVRAS